MRCWRFVVNEDSEWVAEELGVYHAEIVAIIELTLAWRTVMFPVTKGVHMLLDRLLASEFACTSVTFPHDRQCVQCLRRRTMSRVQSEIETEGGRTLTMYGVPPCLVMLSAGSHEKAHWRVRLSAVLVNLGPQ